MDKKLFADLLDSVKEMVAIENDELQAKPEHVHRHVISDVKYFRKNKQLSKTDSDTLKMNNCQAFERVNVTF
ncbi:hypothetical protein PSI15_10030 [Xenorhabdus sp. PR6a]|uniref:hypothetical protein n=1 Tax=Xenorhabdus sp. PR6a TaxID=3025877 RepID=UPI002358ECFD|nr:hypothetical protein [Xenorhabdus sp. PR6a]MDC9581899.1 hypothetical protein [Xenorhabdus sp. PR6a]